MGDDHDVPVPELPVGPTYLFAPKHRLGINNNRNNSFFIVTP